MKNNVLKWLGRVGATLLTTIVILVVGLYLVMAMLAWGPSTFAKKQFILSLQETGELGFMANWFCSQEEIDMIKDPDKILQTEFSEDDICLIAVPSYGGRIPSVTVDKFQKLQAKGTKVILVAVFGNRAIDDTLVEMQDILENAGFVCVVGVEAVAEHSLMHQFGTGRPDQQDEKELIRFSEQIMQKIETKMECMKVELPGNHNYREYNGVPLKPVVNGKCTSCGICAKECPAGAISKDDPKVTDKEKCISCMHCVAVCPQKARHCNKVMEVIASKKMKKSCSGRKENKLYL